MHRILFIGAVNKGQLPAGGEEYKNQLLVKRLWLDSRLTVVDTFNWKKNPIVLFKLLLFIWFFNYDKIVISASSASTYRLVQFLNFFPHLLSKTHYFVIGGYFPEGLKIKKYLSKYYKGLKSIVVEGEILKDQILKVDQLQNVSVISNFKEFDLWNLKSTADFLLNTKRFVFISRISKSKGVDTIFEAVKILNLEGLKGSFIIDFYGKIESEFEFEFRQGLLDTGSNYMGYLDLMNHTAEAYKTLNKYDVMLFPTYWMGEGFPGVIIDAFVSGLPVIATDWNMNKELIEEEETGMIIPIKDGMALASAMSRFIIEDNLSLRMSKNCSEKAAQFHIDKVWHQIQKVLK